MDTGLLRLEYRHFPVLGEASALAAIASECAGEQGKFWDYHQLLFLRSEEEGNAVFTGDGLRTVATDAGLDRSTFDACLSSRRYADRVQADRRSGVELGVRSTPSFIINDRLVVGLQSYDFFRDAIEAEIAKVR